LIIFKYLSKQILQIVAVISFVLLTVALTGRFIQYLGEAVAGEKAPDILLLLMLYRVPEFLLVILPLATFLAIILALGRMYAENEMVVLLSSGMSQKKLLLNVLAVSTVIMLVVGALSFFMSPLGLRNGEALKQTQDQLTEIDLIVAGQFQTFGEGERVTYAARIRENVYAGRELGEVFVALNPDSASNEESPRIIIADAARPYIDPESGARFMQLDNVLQYDGRPGSSEFAIGQFERQSILLPAPEPFDAVLEESTLPTSTLLGSSDVAQLAELQWRISVLLLIPVITLIAIPMSRVNPRQGRYSKLLPAALLYVLYFVSLEFCRDLIAEGELSPVLGLWWVHLLFVIFGVLNFMRDGEPWFAGWRRAA